MTGQELKQARESQGLTQRALGREVGIPQSTLSAFERGEGELTEDQHTALNAYFENTEQTESVESDLTDEQLARTLHERLSAAAEQEDADRYTHNAAAHAASTLRWIMDGKRAKELGQTS